MTSEPCPLCADFRFVAVEVSFPGDPHRETVDMPCRCTEQPKEPENLTPIEELIF